MGYFLITTNIVKTDTDFLVNAEFDYCCFSFLLNDGKKAK